MKRNITRNDKFVDLICTLKKQGKTNQEIQAKICAEWEWNGSVGMDPHSYRAYKSRMKSLYPELEQLGCFSRAGVDKTKELPVLDLDDCLELEEDPDIVGLTKVVAHGQTD